VLLLVVFVVVMVVAGPNHLMIQPAVFVGEGRGDDHHQPLELH